MFKKLIKITLALMIVFAFVAPAHAATLDFWAKVYAWDGSMGADGHAILIERNTGITFAVMQSGSKATLEALRIYGDDTQTALANPVTGTDFADDTKGNDMVSFRVDPSEAGDAVVDVIVVDQVGGYTAFVEGMTVNDHAIVLDERLGVVHHGAAFIVTTTSSTEVDTGIEFERVTIIHNMMIEVGTVFSGGAGSSWINVGLATGGTNGDGDGFIYMEELATAGWHNPFRPGPNLTSYVFTSGAGEFTAALNVALGGALTAGTYIGHFAIGTTDSGAAGSWQGIVNQERLVIYGTWEQSLVYNFATAEATDGWGLIHFWFTRIR
jgi:hypothetical protein